MDFSFSEEQTLLRNSVSKFLADNYTFETFKKISRTEPGWSKQNWKTFAELGLLAAPLPEAYGGLGGGPVDTMIIMEEFGRALVVEPFAPDGRGRRQFPRSRRQRRAERRVAAEDRGRRNRHRVCVCRTARTLQLRGPHHDGEEAGLVLCAERPEGGRAGRALGGPADRHRAHRRAGSATKKA